MLGSKQTVQTSKVHLPSRLRSMTLSLFQEEEIVRGSVVHVYNPDKPYTVSSDHLPITNAINDTRMGVIEHGLVCGTCGGDATSCPGHFGHMVLNVAIFHPAYIKMALSVLRSVCWTCAFRLNGSLNPPEEQALESTVGPKELRRLLWIAKHRQPYVCPTCNAPQPLYEKPKGSATRIRWSWPVKRVAAAEPIPPELVYEMGKPFTAVRARMIFEAIDAETLTWLGLNAATSHPKAFVVRVLPVPPPCVRPSVVKIEGSKMRGQDDLTGILMNICKKVTQLRHASFDDLVSAKRMYEFGIIFDDCSGAEIKRATKPQSKASRREDAKILRERKSEERMAKLTATGLVSNSVQQHALLAHYQRFMRSTPNADIADLPTLPASSSAFCMSVIPELADVLSLPFEENRVDSAIALTRPHTSPATARLGAKPDLRICEHLQQRNSKTLALLELHLTVHLNTDGKDTSIMRQRSGAPKTTIIKRLKAKEGRMRGNLQGKRVFASGRAVISPCQSLDVDELGVPQSMACILTYGNVMVNESTIELLRKCVRIGALRVNGANMVIKGADGTRIYLEYAIDREKIAAELRPGDMVKRYIQDGDLVIFNRQPSLHRLSMMAHRVRIMDSSTFRLNLAATAPYNADCDGDEMNIHVPKGIRAQAEARELMSITKNLISPASNAMTAGIIQDSIVAAYLFTRPTTFLTRAQVHRLLSVVKYPVEGSVLSTAEAIPEPAKVTEVGEPLWSGAQVLSMLFPPWLEVGDPSRTPHVSRGLLHVDPCSSAGITKHMMGRTSNGITHRICVDGSLESGMRFMSDAQRMMHAWMAEAGFTTGLHDAILRDDIRLGVRTLLFDTLTVVDLCAEAMYKATSTATRFVQGEVEQRVRAMVSNVVEAATQMGINYLKSEHDSGGKLTRNGLWDMIASGSKGSSANAFQIAIAVGTQIISGQRIPRDPRTQRTLSCFPQGTNTAASRGLIRNSYVDGMSSTEFYMHNMGGREGLVHTAIKTAETGYLQRRLVKAMEDLIGMSDGSVRDGEMRVVQYLYGGDGLDPTRLQLTPTSEMMSIGRAQVVESEGEEYARMFCDFRAKLREIMTPRPNEQLLLPCDPGRLVRGAIRQGAQPRVLDMFKRRIMELEQEDEDQEPQSSSPPAHSMDVEGDEGHHPPHPPAAKFMRFLRAVVRYFTKRHMGLGMALLWTLRPSMGMGIENGIGLERAREVAAEAASMYEKARMPGGDPCGIISAQSIGEPSTQMTLNSPHHSGRVGSRVTMGVPRLREIIDRRKEGTIETPLMIIPVIADTQEVAEKVMRMVRRIRLRDVLHSSFVAEDPILPSPHPLSNIEKDELWMQDLVSAYGLRESHVVYGREETAAAIPLPVPVPTTTAAAVSTTATAPAQPLLAASPYVIRFSLRRDLMLEMGIAPVTIARAIEKSLVDFTAIILHSPRAAKNWVVRVRLVSDHDTTGTGAEHQGKLHTSNQWYHITQQAHVLILRKACANQAHLVDWATAGKAEYTEVDPLTECIVTKERWVIQASGSSLASMSRIKELDWTKAHTNDITMVFGVLGLEAANALIYGQMLDVMTNDGSYIDPRHLQLLADAITYYGYVMPVRRHGVLRKKTGWAHRASFEEMVSVLMTGAARGEKDDFLAPSGAVMTGQMGAFGSGWVSLFEDPSAPKPIAQKYADMEMRVTGRDIDVDGNTEMERVALGGDSVTRYMDGSSGTLKTRPVEVLRKLHLKNQEERNRQHSRTTTTVPTPIPLAAPKHRYTVAGAVAAMTYDGYGIDFVDESTPHAKRLTRPDGGNGGDGGNGANGSASTNLVVRGERPRANGQPQPQQPTAENQGMGKLDLAGLEATLMSRMGLLNKIKPGVAS